MIFGRRMWRNRHERQFKEVLAGGCDAIGLRGSLRTILAGGCDAIRVRGNLTRMLGADVTQWA